jgi:hypothetical protein
LGGRWIDEASEIVVDSAGDAYVSGLTNSIKDFPVVNSIKIGTGTVLAGFTADIFVTKISSSGSALIYSTLIGGRSDDGNRSIVINSAGEAYIAGTTNSDNFPVLNPIQRTLGGLFDGYIVKINSTGNGLIYSTYLGGSADDQVNGVALDSAENVYLTGGTLSANFPLVAPMQSDLRGRTDAFITKINSSGDALIYSTYLGGRGT